MKTIIKNGKLVLKQGKLRGKAFVLPLRLPTDAEWTAELATWSSEDDAGAYASALKLTMAGYRRRSNGEPYTVGSRGNYWSSTVDGTDTRALLFSSSVAGMPSSARANGFPVRLILNGTFTQAQFDSNYQSLTVEIDGLNYGFCYNPTTQRIWLDRNLGATQVATSSTDTASYGHLFQWGRAADGHEIRTSSLHDGDTLGLATTAEPNLGNDWDGKFITINTSPNDWLTPQDDTLWQGVEGTNNPGTI